MPSTPPSTKPPDSVLQIKIHLKDISPMIWRRVLVPETYTLRELHGVFQVAMGWEGIHLFEFSIRAVGYSSFELDGESADAPLNQFRFRKNAKFIYRYDMGCDWVHDVRVEQRTSVEPKRCYPVCTGGSGACPPEDCGGVSYYLDRRDDALGFEAMEEIAEIADFVDQVVLKERYELLKDEPLENGRYSGSMPGAGTVSR